MRNTHKRQNGSKLGILVAVILVISVIFGFLFDLTLTAIEKWSYPMPDEYASYVNKYSAEYGVPSELVWAVIKTESGFDSSAESSVGAVGLMQLMPETFNEITTHRLKEGLDSGMRYDPETNIRYGTYYLSYLYQRYGNWDAAIAAYNAGLGNVDEWLEIDPLLEDIPFAETRNYLKKVNKTKEKYENIY